MRVTDLALGAMLTVLAGPAIAASIENMPYPGSVALVQEPGGDWTYKSFPSFLPLYIFDGEPSGKSACDLVCSAVWPIIKAADDAKPMGDWTIVLRADGRKQWAYKNSPVYTYFEDSSDPHGAGKNQDWYLDEGGVAFLVKAGVKLPADFKPDQKRSSGTRAVARLLRP